MPVFSGRFFSIWVKASNPQAEAPIPTIGQGWGRKTTSPRLECSPSLFSLTLLDDVDFFFMAMARKMVNKIHRTRGGLVYHCLRRIRELAKSTTRLSQRCASLAFCAGRQVRTAYFPLPEY